MLPWLGHIYWDAFILFTLERICQAVALCLAVIQGSISTVGFVSLHAEELQRAFQTVDSVSLHAAVPLGGLQTLVSVVHLLCLQNSWVCDLTLLLVALHATEIL